MSDSGEDVRQVRSDIERLESEVAELRNRVRLLEAGASPRFLPAPVQQPSPRHELESRLGLTAANRIGAFTLALGIIFFFKYAVDNAWIGAGGRVFAGLMVGSLLITAAEWLNRRGQRTFSQGVSGCGIATLYISLYAAFAPYQLISKIEAFAALVAICSVAIALSIRYANPAIAALGFAGGLFTPLLLHAGDPTVSPDFLYLWLLDVSCIVIAVNKRWAPLIAGVAAATIAAGWYLFGWRHGGVFAVFCLALTAVHGVAAYRYWSVRLLRNVLYPVANGCLILAAFRQVELWTSHNVAMPNRASVTSELDSVFLAVYGVAALVYGLTRQSDINRALALALLGLVIAKLYVWDVWFLERFYRTTAFVGLGVLLLAASWIFSRSTPASERRENGPRIP